MHKNRWSSFRILWVTTFVTILACNEKDSIQPKDISENSTENQVPATNSPNSPPELTPINDKHEPIVTDPVPSPLPIPPVVIPPSDNPSPRDETEKPKIPDPPMAWSPCPSNGDPCRIMPLGDSITNGFHGYGYGGYRVPLFRKAINLGKKITFVGDKVTGPAEVDKLEFPRNNEGHPGWLIEDIKTDNGAQREGISKLVQGSIEKHKPHIILLMIGTNDIASNSDISRAPQRLEKLIDKLSRLSPSTLIVVAEITPDRRAQRDPLIKSYNSKIRSLIKSKIAKKMNIRGVDMYTKLTGDKDWRKTYFADDLHPNYKGFDAMADVWWPAIVGYLR